MTPGIALRDVAVVLALIGAMVAEAFWFPYDDQQLTWLTWVLVVATALPALVSRTHPVAALIASSLMLWPTTHLCPIVQTSPFAAMVAGYWLARTRGRRAAGITVLAMVPWVLFLLGHGGTEKLFSLETPKNLALIALPVVLGLASRYREQSHQALVDRAEHAERNREQEALRRVGEERLRIAREVHDAVSHSMVAINVQAGVGSHLIDQDPATARQTLLDIRRISAETLADLRGILGLLREEGGAAPTEPTLTLDSLRDLESTWRAAGLDLDLRIELDGQPLPAGVAGTAYRVVQEGLTNVLRHAPGSPARVSLTRAGEGLTIEIADRGGERPGEVPGTVPDAVPDAVPNGSGVGLRGMRERVRALGGALDAGPRPDGGWLVRARLPMPSRHRSGTPLPHAERT
ncbi:sensor histidine kinase [Nocardioides insulae]|uniref:sensor histidine kinase n=1 Tax=Nocardioides insulae TaxID=394734 RepID=UPI000406BEED|nr:sensor histidine kinase [Nocardioides insulae]